eukprot:CAMPEP_0198143876 /NCGR_PEP_ID=MMETSP1443-20131203/11240_1 /TAXON_ID=186043 /ORGANISM="Entomoneis sp., Strain CCMP2396" /LENGTH=221 /DNA_ID=CAMNT_0043807177 /DNA_START=38 /DNA_END=703 /DNA_ORIENTATION=+
MKIGQFAYVFSALACFAYVGRTFLDSSLENQTSARGLGTLINLRGNDKFLFVIDVTENEVEIAATRTTSGNKEGKSGKPGPLEAIALGQIETMLAINGDAYPGIKRQYLFPLGTDFKNPDWSHILEFYVKTNDPKGEYINFWVKEGATADAVGKTVVERVAMETEVVYVVPLLRGNFNARLQDGNGEVITYEQGNFKLSANSNHLLDGRDIPLDKVVSVTA